MIGKASYSLPTVQKMARSKSEFLNASFLTAAWGSLYPTSLFFQKRTGTGVLHLLWYLRSRLGSEIQPSLRRVLTKTRSLRIGVYAENKPQTWGLSAKNTLQSIGVSAKNSPEHRGVYAVKNAETLINIEKLKNHQNQNRKS